MKKSSLQLNKSRELRHGKLEELCAEDLTVWDDAGEERKLHVGEVVPAPPDVAVAHELEDVGAIIDRTLQP
jgi:hypothetical protein